MSVLHKVWFRSLFGFVYRSENVPLLFRKLLFSSVQLLSRIRFFATPWTTAHKASPSITNSQSLLRLMSITSVMPSNYLILHHPLLLPPSIFPACASSSPAFLIMYSAYKLNEQGVNIQPYTVNIQSIYSHWSQFGTSVLFHVQF